MMRVVVAASVAVVALPTTAVAAELTPARTFSGKNPVTATTTVRR
jgi:hypothetical protein